MSKAHPASTRLSSPSPLAGEGRGEGVSSQKAFLQLFLFGSTKIKQALFAKRPPHPALRADLPRKGRGDENVALLLRNGGLLLLGGEWKKLSSLRLCFVLVTLCVA